MEPAAINLMFQFALSIRRRADWYTRQYQGQVSVALTEMAGALDKTFTFDSLSEHNRDKELI